MITGIGVTLMITGILCYVVVENFRPECASWKKRLVNAIILSGAVLTLVGYFV